MLVAAATWSGGHLLGTVIPGESNTLGPCERNEALFDNNVGEEENIVNAWSTTYHEQVRTIIDEHVEFLEKGGTCMEENVRPPAEKELKELAATMPSWKKNAHVSQEDMPNVLADYLREYECALQERAVVVGAAVYYDYVAAGDDAEPADPGKSMSLDTYDDDVATQTRRLHEEQTIARDALRNTLTYLSGHTRVWRLRHSLQCLEGSMLDIRNALALAADASSCMPKIWDAQTFLRTFITE